MDTKLGEVAPSKDLMALATRLEGSAHRSGLAHQALVALGEHLEEREVMDEGDVASHLLSSARHMISSVCGDLGIAPARVRVAAQDAAKNANAKIDAHRTEGYWLGKSDGRPDNRMAQIHRELATIVKWGTYPGEGLERVLAKPDLWMDNVHALQILGATVIQRLYELDAQWRRDADAETAQPVPASISAIIDAVVPGDGEPIEASRLPECATLGIRSDGEVVSGTGVGGIYAQVQAPETVTGMLETQDGRKAYAHDVDLIALHNRVTTLFAVDDLLTGELTTDRSRKITLTALPQAVAREGLYQLAMGEDFHIPHGFRVESSIPVSIPDDIPEAETVVNAPLGHLDPGDRVALDSDGGFCAPETDPLAPDPVGAAADAYTYIRDALKGGGAMHWESTPLGSTIRIDLPRNPEAPTEADLARAGMMVGKMTIIAADQDGNPVLDIEPAK